MRFSNICSLQVCTMAPKSAQIYKKVGRFDYEVLRPHHLSTYAPRSFLQLFNSIAQFTERQIPSIAITLTIAES